MRQSGNTKSGVRTFSRPGPFVRDPDRILQVPEQERTDANARPANIDPFVGEVAERELSDDPQGEQRPVIVHGLRFDTAPGTDATPGQLVKLDGMQGRAPGTVVNIVVEGVETIRDVFVKIGACVDRNRSLKEC